MHRAFAQGIAQLGRQLQNDVRESNNHLDAGSRWAHRSERPHFSRKGRARNGAPAKIAVMAELVAYVDGGCLGNPGPSAIGVVIDGCENGPIRIAKWIGHQDNNVAEYAALMEALQCAVSLKACLLYTSPSPRDRQKSRMPSSA